MNQFRQLMQVALLSGTLAGLVLFAAQYFLVVPRIKMAETYEAASHQEPSSAGPEAQEHHEHQHEDEGWKPAEGAQRTLFTALSTVLTGIGFASVLFAVVRFRGKPVNAYRGILWGLAGFACFVLAPSLGLPPQLPGVPEADLYARQIWWACTVGATAAGLFLTAGPKKSLFLRAVGVLVILLPHWFGAPAVSGFSIVPRPLIRQFIITSIAANGLFWILLGAIGGFLYRRYESLNETAHQNPRLA